MLIVDDTCLTKNEVSFYQDLIYLKNQVPWVFTKGGPDIPASKHALPGPNTENNMQLVHLARRGNSEKHLSKLSGDLTNLLHKFAHNNNIDVLSIERIKCNIIINSRSIKNQTNTPHVDSVQDIAPKNSDGEHMVLLYYVNDSDGDTVLYNEKYPVESPKDLSVFTSVTPKAGRAILFEGDRYHSSSSPVDTYFRCVVNINFTGKRKQNV